MCQHAGVFTLGVSIERRNIPSKPRYWAAQRPVSRSGLWPLLCYFQRICGVLSESSRIVNKGGLGVIVALSNVSTRKRVKVLQVLSPQQFIESIVVRQSVLTRSCVRMVSVVSC